ncbi:unnamed protein product [Ceutorhynchus assimilis]|uniref:THAP-type domain-containing protein n=1 Tax=Ceutorhynchus assimilis TaxID=467358 RepID=A0A9N9MUY6_9CUCU|nr:unnamed protein product [Ceutorhynchus assimilis]
MPGCAAVHCNNSAKKGFLMKRFPRDPERRKQWLVNTKRGNWTPTDYSFLCEIHFDPEMWEKTREDGSRKLKVNAVPTLFSFSLPKNPRKPPASPAVKKLLLPRKVKSSPGKAMAAVERMIVADIEVNFGGDHNTTDSVLPISQPSSSQNNQQQAKSTNDPLVTANIEVNFGGDHNTSDSVLPIIQPSTSQNNQQQATSINDPVVIKSLSSQSTTSSEENGFNQRIL